MRQSGAETLVTEEPYAFIAHVRVCGGADWVTIGSTRKPTPNSLRSCVAAAIGRGSPRAFGYRKQNIAGVRWEDQGTMATTRARSIHMGEGQQVTSANP